MEPLLSLYPTASSTSCGSSSAATRPVLHTTRVLRLHRILLPRKVKRILGYDSAHVEIAPGSNDQCVAYCTKEDTRLLGPFTLGEPQSDKATGPTSTTASTQ